MKTKNIASFGLDHNGKHYVIKVFHVGHKLTALPYFNNKLVGSSSYSVELDNLTDWVFYYGDLPPCAQLLKIVVDAIEKGFGIKREE